MQFLERRATRVILCASRGFIVLLGLLATLSFGANIAAVETEANVMAEIVFRAARTYGDPFNDVTLDAVFRDPAGRDLRVPAFWAGSNVWKVRYASPLVGTHTFRTECSKSNDPGLHGVTGEVRVAAYEGNNPFFVHGPLQVAADGRHLEHTDHTPFFWLGDTWWMGLCHRLHWPDEVKQLAADRKAKGFNVIQIVAGLYPDMYPFDARGANEAGFPWETNYTRIRPEYFDAADQRLGYLVDQGLSPCVVGAWGYFLPWMGVEKMKAHWRYLIARYGAWPVTWCAAGEANLPWYQVQGFPYDDRKQVDGWTEVMRYIRATDPYHRPLTIHPTGIGRLSARHATDDPALLDFDLLQTPHGRREAVPITITTVGQSYGDTPRMPVIDGEASYERLGDNLPTEWTRRMFWICLMNGACGHTYGANGIWQCNRRGQPHGPSPTAGSGPTGYGVISWDEAMNLPGSRQVGLGKKFLEGYSWQKFQPQPKLVSFAVGDSGVRLAGSSWIWFPEGNPAQDAPAQKRFFRRTFVLPPDQRVAEAALRASADDSFIAEINGKVLGSSDDWRSDRQFIGIQNLLKSGTNVLTIIAENKPAGGMPDPAGLIACLKIRLASGADEHNENVIQLVTDATWRCATNETPGWKDATFDDSRWSSALVVAPYGSGPWGILGSEPEGPLFGPQSAGIPGAVRVVYVPENKPIRVVGLDHGKSYKARYFDPVTGTEKSLAPFRIGMSRAWMCPPPPGNTHDWVVVVEPVTR